MIKIIGDLHYLGDDKIDKKINETLNDIIEEGDVVFFVGDVFDKYNIAFKDNYFYKFLQENDKCKYYILIGNHDFSGEMSFKIINYFSDYVYVIDDLKSIVFDNYNFILDSFRRYDNKIDRYKDLIKDNYKNILLTHTEFTNKEINKLKDKFDYIVNGHIHLFNKDENFINLGAIREVVYGERGDKYYIKVDKDLELVKIKQNVEIVRYNIENLDSIDLKDNDKVYVVNILKNNESNEEIEKIIKEKFGDNVIININRKNIEMDVEKVKEDVNNVENMNYENLFLEYYNLFCNEYKFDKISKEEALKMFKEYFLEELKKSGSILDLKINRLECKNFRLFKDVKIDFERFKGITYIKGKNLDEISNNVESSNEAGKSTIANAILYCLDVLSKINPISYNEKEGYVKLYLEINKDIVEIERKFILRKNKIDTELHIKINGNLFYDDDTNTNKMKFFNEKYNIENVVKYIFLNNFDMLQVLFSNRSSEKKKMLEGIFSSISVISNVLDRIDKENKEKKAIFEKKEIEYNNILDKRKDYFNLVKDNFVKLRKEITILEKEKVNKNDIKIDFDIEKMTNNINLIKFIGLEKIKRYKKLNEEYFTKLENNKKNREKIKYLKEEIEKIEKNNDLIGVKEFSDYDIDIVYKEEGYYKKLKGIDGIKIDFDLNRRYEEDKIRLEKELNEIENKYNLLRKNYTDVKDLIKKLNNSINEKKCEFCGSVLSNLEQIEKIKNEKTIELKNIEEEGKKVSLLLQEKKKELEQFDIVYNKYLEVKKILGDLSILSYKFNYKEEEIQDIIKYNKVSNYIKILKEKKNELKEIESKIYNDIVEYDDLNVNEYLKVKEIEVIENIEEVERKIKEYKEREEEIKNIEYKLKVNYEMYNKLVEDINKFNRSNRIKKIKKEYEEIKREFERIDNFYYLLKGKINYSFDKFYINKIIDELNIVYNKFLCYLFNRNIKFNANEFIFEDEGNEVEFNNFSSGCKTKIVMNMLITILILYKKFGLNTNMIFLDEIFDRAVDNVNYERMLNVLNVIKNDFEKIFLISHKDNNFIKFDNIINVVRKNNKSEIEVV